MLRRSEFEFALHTKVKPEINCVLLSGLGNIKIILFQAKFG